jgi:methylated-DNA-[protein]-cysteine S-methyltransferase
MFARQGQDRFYAVWATAWGAMGAVAGCRGLTRVVLPHYQPKDLQELLAWEHPGAARDEGPFELLIELSRCYFNGKGADFSAVACDLPADSSFAGKVLRACRGIPYGQTRSYHALAEMIGLGDSARAVAAALGKNPLPLAIPCHRVTYADGRLGGFSCPGGTELKAKMLELERRGLPSGPA